jgi:hypothetical protein
MCCSLPTHILVTILAVFRRTNGMRNIHTALIRKTEERNYVEDYSTYGTIILKWTVIEGTRFGICGKNSRVLGQGRRSRTVQFHQTVWNTVTSWATINCSLKSETFRAPRDHYVAQMGAEIAQYVQWLGYGCDLRQGEGTFLRNVQASSGIHPASVSMRTAFCFRA